MKHSQNFCGLKNGGQFPLQSGSSECVRKNIHNVEQVVQNVHVRYDDYVTK